METDGIPGPVLTVTTMIDDEHPRRPTTVNSDGFIAIGTRMTLCWRWSVDAGDSSFLFGKCIFVIRPSHRKPIELFA